MALRRMRRRPVGTSTGRHAAARCWAVDRWLVLGKVGGAWVNEDFVRMRRVSDDTSSGLLLGVGAEYAFQNNWTAKIEYNRMNVDRDVDVVKFGLNYRFGLNPLPGRW
jgi:opacity protein-like surface antigen